MKQSVPIILLLLFSTLFAENAKSEIPAPLTPAGQAQKKTDARAAQILRGQKDIHILFEANVIETLTYQGKNVSIDSSIIKKTVKDIFHKSASEYGIMDSLIFDNKSGESSGRNILKIIYSLRSKGLPTKTNTIVYSAVTFHVSFKCNTCRSPEEELMVQQHLNRVSTRIKSEPFILTYDFSRDFKAPNLGYHIPKVYERGLEPKYILKNVGDSFGKGVSKQLEQLSLLITKGKISWP